MTESQADILDELYFVTSFQALADALALDTETLCPELEKLIRLGYIKCFYPDPETEVEFEATRCGSYFFLATKAGLLAHNSR